MLKFTLDCPTLVIYLCMQGFRVMELATTSNVLGGRGWGIDQNPSVSKSNRLHVDIFRLFFMRLGYIPYILLN
jgi:hypothetical protein